MVVIAVAALAACSADNQGVIVPGEGDFDAGRGDGPGADRAATADLSPAGDARGADAGAPDARANGDAETREGGANPREICNNGLDDDADGRVDDGCACVPGTSQQCYPRARAEAERAPCAWGTQGCEGKGEFGTWTECVGAVTPVDEVCGDGVDQDCTGAADDGARCACVPGQARPCYEGPSGAAGGPASTRCSLARRSARTASTTTATG